MHSNGHLPDGAKVVTLEQLRAASLKYVKAAMLSERFGSDVYVRIRAIRRAAYLQMLPPPPPGSDAWPTTGPERAVAMQAWLVSLPEDERAVRQRAIDEVTYKVLAAGMAEPTVTLESAKDWADDADILAVEILRFSGMLPEEKPEETPAEAVPDLTQAPA